jgi:hypothetical protein
VFQDSSKVFQMDFIDMELNVRSLKKSILQEQIPKTKRLDEYVNVSSILLNTRD